MELVDMNSLGLFNFLILSVQVGFTLYFYCVASLARAVFYIYKNKYVVD
jgi:hypothetical protein